MFPLQSPSWKCVCGLLLLGCWLAVSTYYQHLQVHLVVHSRPQIYVHVLCRGKTTQPPPVVCTSSFLLLSGWLATPLSLKEPWDCADSSLRCSRSGGSDSGSASDGRRSHLPNHQRRYAKRKLSRNMHALHTRFRTFRIRFACSVDDCRQSFCVGAQEEVY